MNANKINPKRRKKYKRNIWRGRILIIVLLISVFYFIFSSSFFRLSKIEIHQIKQIKPEEILREIKIKPCKNIFTVRCKKIENVLKNHPKIKEVKVRKKYPNTLQVIIKERKPVLALKGKDIFAIIDKEGQIMEIRTFNMQNLQIPVVDGVVLISPLPGKNVLDEKIKACVIALSSEKKIYPHKILRFEFEGRKMRFFTSYDLEVRMGRIKTENDVKKISEKMERLSRVLNTAQEKGILLEYVDISSSENIAAHPRKKI